MRISHKYKFIYYSIPKTASESIRSVLDPLSDVNVVTYPKISLQTPFYSHMRPIEANKVFQSLDIDIADYFTFATVRNPWQRMASLYCLFQKYQRRFHNKNLKKKIINLIGTNFTNRQDQEFAKWLAAIDAEKLIDPPTKNKWYDHGLLNYSSFMKCEPGHKGVDKVFKIEDGLLDLIEDLKQHTKGAFCSKKIPHLNKNTTHLKYEDMYDSCSIKAVEQLFSSDIKKYGYTFFD